MSPAHPSVVSARLRRRSSRGLASLAFAAIALVVFAGTVLGHHSLISATYGCNGVVNYTAHSWTTDNGTGQTLGQATNPNVSVKYSIDGLPTSNPAKNWISLPSGAFNAGNNYQFSGSFSATSPTVDLLVHEVANWADGAGPEWNSANFLMGLTPANCATPTPTPVVTPTPEVTPTPTPDVTPTPTPDVTPTPDATPTPTPVVTPTPSASIAGETATPAPVVTPPTTSTVDGSGTGSAGSNLILAGFAMAGLGLAALLLTPRRARRTR